MSRISHCRNFRITIVFLCCTVITVSYSAGQRLSQELIKHFYYREIGPTRQGGRIVDFAVPDSGKEPYTFYIAAANGGLWKTVNNGTTFFPIFDNENVFAIGDVAVAPSDPNIIWVGTGEPNNSTTDPYATYWGDGVYMSADGGSSWRNMGLGDTHQIGRIVIHPKNPEVVYVAALGHLYSDNEERGVYKTTDGGKTWYHPDELPLAQLYEIGIDLDYPYNVYGGMQDFGTWKGPSTKKGRFPIRFEDWEHMLGGDGYYCQVDPTSNRWLYAESQNGSLSVIDMKTGQRKNIHYRGDEDIRFNFSAPILISPHNSNVLYHGANVVLRSSNRGESWKKVSPDLTTNDPRLRDVGPLAYCTITTLAESPVQQGVLWVGTDDGNIQLTKDGGKTWIKLNDHIPDYPGCWVSRVVASFHDAKTAYVTFTGRRRDDFRPYVYETADFGMTWVSIASDLPQDEPVNVIRENLKNPDLLFIGTEKAVYVSIDSGKYWTKMKNNMPTAGVKDLVIQPRENDLVVGTHGRGFFIADISPLQEMTPEVLAKDVFLFDIEPKVQWVMPSQKAVSAQNFTGENEPYGVVFNYYLKDALSDGVTIQVYDGSILINELQGSGNAGFNSVVWGMTKRGRKRTAEEIARYDRRVTEGETEPFYDYYDTVDYFGNPDEEVDKRGLSLRTRVARAPGTRGREYVFKRVQPGEYTIKLIAGEKVLIKKSIILQDHWYKIKY